MKILHVISAMTVEAGGPPFVCAGLASAQVQLGHEVTIATVDFPLQQRLPVDPPVRVEYFPLSGTPRYAASPKLAQWLQRHVQEMDFVHLHSVWQFPTFAAARACWEFHKPYVVLLNGMLDVYSVEQHNYMLKRLYWAYRERRVLGRAQALHCLNQAEIRRAVTWIDPMPKFVAGNGVSAAELADLPARGTFRARHPEIGDRPLVLFLSRLHPKKGLDRLLPGLAQRQPDVVFAIAGTGSPEYVAHLDVLIKGNGLEGKVLRVGQLAGRDKWAALVDSDVFVLPSYQEGFSMAITEAMAAGCPVVVTEECNFDEVERHRAGRVIGRGDMREFVKAVETLLVDASLRRQLGQNGRQLVEERYTWERIGADMVDVYRWALSGRTFSVDGWDVWRRRGDGAARTETSYRIVHVLDSLNPGAGGPATVASRLAAAQAAMGHDVTVLAYLGPGEQELIQDSLRDVPAIDRVKLEFIPKVKRWDRILTISAKTHLNRLIASSDVVHLHGIWEPLLVVAASMAREFRVPYVVRACGMLDPWSLRQHWLKKRIALLLGYRRMLNKAAFLHALNRDEKRLIELLGLKCPMEVISNGVFLDEIERMPPVGTFHSSHPELQGKPFILFLSRLHMKKGLDYLASAFALVCKKNEDVHLVVAGPDNGAAEPFLRQVQGDGVAARVHLVGPQYGMNKLAALRDATVFCLPSRQEGFSLAITEALACGIPAVISEACHFPEVAENQAGMVVDLEPSAIAEALVTMLESPAMRESMGKAGAALVREQYTWPRVSEHVIAAYQRAIERAGKK